MSASPIPSRGSVEGIGVLHVDDDPSFADMVASFLEREDDRFEVTTATSPSEGLTYLDGTEFDCIVSDYDMPHRNGIEFLEMVRERATELPFILYTGKGSEEIASDAITAGVTDYLQKTGGTSQYTVLANRITNAVEQYRAKREVQNSEKRLSLFFDQSPLGVMEWDDDFTVVRMNDAAEDILGYSQDELVGQSWETIVSESDQDRVADVVTDVLDDKGGYHIVNENVRKDGDRIICEWHNRVVTDTAGDVVAIYSQFRDVTERREREHELERYEAYLQESTDIVTVLDETGAIKYGSPSMARILGYDPGELVGQDGFELIHPDDVDEAYEEFTELVSEPGAKATIECRFRTADDEWLWLEVRGTNRLNQEPVNGVVTNNRDITERKAREQELQRKERRYQAVFNDPNILVGLIDTDGTVLDINQTAMEYVDTELAEVIGEPFWRTSWFDHSDELQQEVREWIAQAASGNYVEFEADLVRPSGDSYTVEGVFRPVTNDDGEVVSLLISDRDITERKERERELEQLTDKYETIFDHSRDAIFLLDVEDEQTFRIAEINEREEELLGRSASEIKGKTPHDLYDEETADRAVDPYRRCLTAGESITDVAEYELDGEARAFETTLQPVWDDGEITQIVGISREITERRQRQRELELFREMLDQSTDSILVIDPETARYLDVNETACRRRGYSREEMLELTVPDVETELPDMEAWHEFIDELQFEEEITFDGTHRCKDGSTYPVEVNVTYLDLNREYVVAIARDVTDRKLREERVQKANELLSTLFETLPVGVAVLNADGEITRANRRAEDVLGIAKSEITGRTYDDPAWTIIDEHGDSIPNADLPFAQVMRSCEAVFDYEHGIELPDGSERWLSINAAPLSPDTDSVDRVVSTITDVTDRREAERAIHRQNKRLEEFVSIISHDLRNPLDVAQGRLELAQEECDDQNLADVARAHERMDALIHDLLMLAREGAEVSELEPLDLTDLIERCWRNVETAEATIRIDLDRTIRGDRSRLQQLLENLMRNAVEHGGADVELTVGELDDGFYVEDDGRGIPREERDDIFEMGYSTAHDGTGFGLSIVKEVVESHGWTIRVTDGSEGGARFEITGVEPAGE